MAVSDKDDMVDLSLSIGSALCKESGTVRYEMNMYDSLHLRPGVGEKATNDNAARKLVPICSSSVLYITYVQ